MSVDISNSPLIDIWKSPPPPLEDRIDAEVAELRVDSSGSAATEDGPVLKIEVVEEVLARLGQGEPVQRLAREYAVDRRRFAPGARADAPASPGPGGRGWIRMRPG